MVEGRSLLTGCLLWIMLLPLGPEIGPGTGERMLLPLCPAMRGGTSNSPPFLGMNLPISLESPSTGACATTFRFLVAELLFVSVFGVVKPWRFGAAALG